MILCDHTVNTVINIVNSTWLVTNLHQHNYLQQHSQTIFMHSISAGQMYSDQVAWNAFC